MTYSSNDPLLVYNSRQSHSQDNNRENFYNKMPSTIAPHSNRLLLAAKLSSLTRKALEIATVNDEAFFLENQKKKQRRKLFVLSCFFRCRVRIAIGNENKFLVQISL